MSLAQVTPLCRPPHTHTHSLCLSLSLSISLSTAAQVTPQPPHHLPKSPPPHPWPGLWPSLPPHSPTTPRPGVCPSHPPHPRTAVRLKVVNGYLNAMGQVRPLCHIWAWSVKLRGAMRLPKCHGPSSASVPHMGLVSEVEGRDEVT